MLQKFKVKNFKNFDDITLDLASSDYKFNPECIQNNLVKTSIVYGINASGKSNLGFAIFDIIRHLTSHSANNYYGNHYRNYLNKNSATPYAEFEYCFKFDENIVIYKYSKQENGQLIDEELKINNHIVLSISKKNGSMSASFGLQGTDTLNHYDATNTNISIVNYVKNNAILDDCLENNIFNRFYDFVNKMLFFRSLKDDIFLGLVDGDKFDSYVILNNNVVDFEKFLNNAGIHCKLSIANGINGKELAFNFNGKYAGFFDIASQGTKALTAFYFWYKHYIKVEKVSFVFIDEFDAFYHQKLSKLIVETLKQTNIQVIFTTHNTSIMTNDLLRPDCYYLIKNGEINPINKLTDKELREAHNLEKLYKSNLFE